MPPQHDGAGDPLYLKQTTSPDEVPMNSRLASLLAATALVVASGPGSIAPPTSANLVADASVAVMAVPVAAVKITPSVSNLVDTTQLYATVEDANGNVLTGRSVKWSSSNASVAMASPAGLTTGVGVGSALITAESEGFSGAAAVRVSAGPPTLPPTPAMPGPSSAFWLDIVGTALGALLVRCCQWLKEAIQSRRDERERRKRRRIGFLVLVLLVSVLLPIVVESTSATLGYVIFGASAYGLATLLRRRLKGWRHSHQTATA